MNYTINLTTEEFELIKDVMEFYADTVEDLNFGEKPENLTSVLHKLKAAVPEDC